VKKQAGGGIKNTVFDENSRGQYRPHGWNRFKGTRKRGQGIQKSPTRANHYKLREGKGVVQREDGLSKEGKKNLKLGNKLIAKRAKGENGEISKSRY